MVKGGCLLSQILGLVPRVEFQRIVREHEGEKAAKGFTCWDQFVAMMFCQLGQAHSLGEIVGGLGSMMGKRIHLGLRGAPKKSTLSYANAHRPWEIYRDTFFALLDSGRRLVGDHLKRPLRFRSPLFSMDATVLDLCLSLFPWAEFRQTKGAVKLHLLLNHEGYLPVFADITPGKTHEVTVGRAWNFPKGSVVVFDKGYWDFSFFSRLCQEKVFFVTRMKVNALYEVLERREAPERGNILSDEIIRLSSAKGQALCSYRLRRVTVWIPEKQETLVLLTNHLGFGPTTVAAIYKERWQIELFFKALKGNLRIKSFVGTSKNALYTQIWTALIAMLMLKLMALRSKLGWSLSTLAAMLRWNLFTHRDLWDWVDNPYGPPPDETDWEHPSLFDHPLGQHLVFLKRGASS